MREIAHVPYCFICSLENRARFSQENMAGLSESDCFAGSLEKLDAKFIFKIANLSAHSWLRNVKFLGSRAQNVLSFCHSDEVTKVP